MAAPRSAAFVQSRGRQLRGARAGDFAKAIARRRQDAATAMRAQPTRRGLGVPSLARRVITDPVVPHDTAARQTRTRPTSIAPLVYGSDAPIQHVSEAERQPMEPSERRFKPGDPT